MTCWKLIETAPKDDQNILLWDGSVCIGWWDGSGEYRTMTDFMGPYSTVKATHWMALPEGPKLKESLSKSEEKT